MLDCGNSEKIEFDKYKVVPDHYAVGIREYRNTVFKQPDYMPAYIKLAELLIEFGFFGQAAGVLKKAALIFPNEIRIGQLLQKAKFLMKERVLFASSRKTIFGMHVLKYVGCGHEGAVYLVENKIKKKLIVKAFHQPEISMLNQDGYGGILRKPVLSPKTSLIKLEDSLKRQSCSDVLYPFDLLYEENEIIGLKYEYEKAFSLPDNMCLDQSYLSRLIGAFAKSQYYLLKNCGLSLGDAEGNFVVTSAGKIKFIDYGRSIIRVDDFRCQEDHQDIMAFLRLFLGMVQPEARKIMEKHDLNTICELIIKKLETLFNDLGISAYYSALTSQRYDLFHEPSFHRPISESLCNKVSKFKIMGLLEKRILKRLGMPNRLSRHC